MTEQNKQWTFKVEDIFQDIPEDPENVNMTIPPEVAEVANLKPGDKLKVLWGDQGTIIIQKIEEKEKNEQE